MAILTKKDPSNLEEYFALIDLTLFEISDLRAAIEFDGEGMQSVDFLDDLERDLNDLKAHLMDGSHLYAVGDLPYMAKIKRVDHKTLPFKTLLEDINRTHRNGMRIDDD